MNLSPEMVIALCALGLTLYQAWLTRRHNRLSVMPHLDWTRARQRSDDGIALRFLLINTGIGPAIIKRREFLIAGKLFVSSGRDCIEDLATHCFGGKLTYRVRQHSLLGIGAIVPAGHHVCVAEVFFPGLKPADESQIEACLQPLVFEVAYESFYRERFRFTTADQRQRATPVV